MLKVRNSALMNLLIHLMAVESGRDFKCYFDDYAEDFIKRLEGSEMMQLKSECEIILKTVLNVMDELLTQEVNDESSNES